MLTERCIVDNRVFLLGLDKLYRDAMKRHERVELLSCARRVAAALHVTPTSVPVEGYYAEDQQLTEYFRLVRALQQVDESRTSKVAALPEFLPGLRPFHRLVPHPLVRDGPFGDASDPLPFEPQTARGDRPSRRSAIEQGAVHPQTVHQPVSSCCPAGRAHAQPSGHRLARVPDASVCPILTLSEAR